jgi:hypothetical protein
MKNFLQQKKNNRKWSHRIRSKQNVLAPVRFVKTVLATFVKISSIFRRFFADVSKNYKSVDTVNGEIIAIDGIKKNGEL